MAKLYFRYGTVGSAKTLNLLAVAHNYRQQNKKILLMKPHLDTRTKEIKSRCGLNCPADFIITPSSILTFNNEPLTNKQNIDINNHHYINLNTNPRVYCILVDECQFLEPSFIDQLYFATIKCNIPVILYGLKNNFKNNLFQGSKRILELCDSIEEIKTICWFCNKKAIHNLKFTNNRTTISGAEIEMGFESTYKPTCKHCYNKKINI